MLLFILRRVLKKKKIVRLTLENAIVSYSRYPVNGLLFSVFFFLNFLSSTQIHHDSALPLNPTDLYCSSNGENAFRSIRFCAATNNHRKVTIITAVTKTQVLIFLIFRDEYNSKPEKLFEIRVLIFVYIVVILQ